MGGKLGEEHDPNTSSGRSRHFNFDLDVEKRKLVGNEFIFLAIHSLEANQ